MNAILTAPPNTLDQLVGVRVPAPQPTKDGRMSGSLVAWAVAADWVTVTQAAQLMGLDYTEGKILQLIDIGGIVAEQVDGRLRVELRSLSEYRESLWEIVTA